MNPAPESTRRAALTGRIILALATLCVAEMVSAFETTMAIQLLYAPGEFFEDVGLASLSWLVTAFMLAGGISVAFSGRLGDQFGRKRVLVGILVVALTGSLVSALAPTFWLVVVGRAIQGVSVAVLPLAIGIVRESFPQSLHGLGIAFVTTTALSAGSSGLLVGGVILDNAGWRWIFWTAVILAALAAVLTQRAVPASPRGVADEDSRIDIVGGVLLGVSIGAVLYGITRADAVGWGNSLSLWLVLSGAFGLLAWVIWEKRIDYPMVQLSRFRNRKFALGMLATALLGVGPIGMSTILTVTLSRTPDTVVLADGSTLDLPVGIGLSPTLAGVIGFVGAAAGFCMSPIVGTIAARWGARVTLFVGCVIVITGFSLAWLEPSSTVLVIGGLWLVSIGTAFTYSGMPTIISESVPDHEVSAATGLNVVVRTTFQALAATIVALLISIDPIAAGGESVVSSTGLSWAIGAIIVTSLVVMAIVSRISGVSPRVGTVAVDRA